MSIAADGPQNVILTYDRSLKEYSGPPPAGITATLLGAPQSINAVGIGEEEFEVNIQMDLAVLPDNIAYNNAAGSIQDFTTEVDAASFSLPMPWP